jgi:hypothetical protein
MIVSLPLLGYAGRLPGIEPEYVEDDMGYDYDTWEAETYGFQDPVKEDPVKEEPGFNWGGLFASILPVVAETGGSIYEAREARERAEALAEQRAAEAALARRKAEILAAQRASGVAGSSTGIPTWVFIAGGATLATVLLVVLLRR